MSRIRGPYVRFCERDEAATPHPTRLFQISYTVIIVEKLDLCATCRFYTMVIVQIFQRSFYAGK
ncbi:hypothetical protein B6N13_21205 [Marinomonas sp. UCMA 3892]|nr:hypothetical protein [Marinomonas sp. UCMA 3892]